MFYWKRTRFSFLSILVWRKLRVFLEIFFERFSFCLANANFCSMHLHRKFFLLFDCVCLKLEKCSNNKIFTLANCANCFVSIRFDKKKNLIFFSFRDRLITEYQSELKCIGDFTAHYITNKIHDVKRKATHTHATNGMRVRACTATHTYGEQPSIYSVQDDKYYAVCGVLATKCVGPYTRIQTSRRRLWCGKALMRHATDVK